MKDCDTIDRMEDLKKMKHTDFAIGEFLRAPPRKKTTFVVPENETMCFKTIKEPAHDEECPAENDEETGTCLATIEVQDIVDSINKIAMDTKNASSSNSTAVANSGQNNLISCGSELMSFANSNQYLNTDALFENKNKSNQVPCPEPAQKTKISSQPKHPVYQYQNPTPRSNSETLNLTITHHMVSSTRQLTISHQCNIPSSLPHTRAEQNCRINSYSEAQKGNAVGMAQLSQSQVSTRRARIWRKPGSTTSDFTLQKLGGTKRELFLENVGEMEKIPKRSRCRIFEVEDRDNTPTAGGRG